MALTEDRAATVSAEMAAQRSAELAGDEAHYRLKKACVARAMELYEALKYQYDVIGIDPKHAQLLKEIEHDAQ